MKVTPMKLTAGLILLIGVATMLAFLPMILGARAETLLEKGKDISAQKPEGYPVATFAGGCFWCLESEIRGKDGILFTRVGYIGGESQNPTYQQISAGNTGHAEATEFSFDPAKVSFEKLTELFLTKWHDPTQLNRQGVDEGTQYRSAIFYHNEEQKKIAEDMIKTLNASGKFSKPIVTEVKPAGTFWEAEGYHQQYYEKYNEKTGQDHIRVVLKKAGKLFGN
jgi:peptide-methionine (S)-S-oxide reductase